MSLYDTFRELTLHIEEVVTDVHVQPISPEFMRKTTVVHLRPEPYFRHIGMEGLGEDVTYDATEHEPHRWPWIDLARRLDARVVLERGSTSSTSSRRASRSRPPTATTAAGRSSRPRSTWR